MNGLKSALVCVLIVLLGSVFLGVRTAGPEAEASPKPTPKVEQSPTEKAVAAEAVTRSKTETAAADLCQCVGRDSSVAAQKIEQALAGPLHSTGLDYTDQPLQDVVTVLSEEYGIPIQIDKPALDEAGISTDSKVSETLHNISLRSALRLTLRTLQLTWVIQDEVLMITTKENAEKDLDTCVYNVQGLVDESDPKSMKWLIDSICACVATDTWATNGCGQAEIRPLPPGLLAVSQTPAIQEEVGALLAKIREMRELVPIIKSRPPAPVPPSRSSSTSSEQSKKAGATTAFATSGTGSSQNK